MAFLKGRIWLILAVLGCLLSAAAAWSVQGLRKERDDAVAALEAAEDTIRSYEAADRIVTETAEKREKMANKEKIKREKLDAALIRNQDWANQPVPADVLAGLRD